MKAIWTGSIGFGLVNIPVRLFSAINESELDLDMLDKKDHANIRYKRVNENTGKEVPWKDIVKGYKLNGKYVVLTDDDFQQASPEKSKIIEIKEFIHVEDIDPILYEKSYYLEPAESGKKAYVLLREALKKSQKAGLGSFVLRNKEHLCVLRSHNSVIILQNMRFAQEIKKTDEIKVPASSPTTEEMKMAINLIDQLSSKKVNFEKYKDNYTAELLNLIKKKSKGAKIAPPKLKVVHRGTTDLMQQLKASLTSNKKRAS